MQQIRWKLAQNLESRWWSNYLKDKDKEEYLNWKRDYWTDFLDRLPEDASNLKGLDIADIGCGPAGIFTVLDQSSVFASDPLLSKYQEQLPQFEQSDFPWVSFQTSSLEEGIPKRSFDRIFCLNAINHVKDLNLAFSNLAEGLKENGYLILSSDVHKKSWTRNLFKFCSWMDPLHPQQDSAKDYESLFARKGFKIEKTWKHKENFLFEYRVWVLRSLPTAG